jgi:thioredoxin 1
MKQPFHDLAAQHPDVIFLSVDVDEHEELTSERGINAMPTFQFFRDQKQVDTLLGASPNALVDKIQRHK